MTNNIETLININIKLWHEITKIKDFEGNIKEKKITEKERVVCTLKIRDLNALRSSTRWEINNEFGDKNSANETKIFTGSN